MMRSRTSWIAKLRPDQQPKLVRDAGGRGLMLIPTPLLVAGVLRTIKRGRTTTPSRIRARLARAHGAAVTCPLTTGIFLSIIAGAAEEQLQSGKRPVAPYWRVVRDDGSLNPRFPPGPSCQARHLRAEGVALVATPGEAKWRLRGTRIRRR